MKLLSYKSAAEILDCSPSKVQKMCLKGELPIVKVGNETRIREEDLKAWIDRGRHYHEPKNCSDSNGKQPIPTTETVFARTK